MSLIKNLLSRTKRESRPQLANPEKKRLDYPDYEETSEVPGAVSLSDLSVMEKRPAYTGEPKQRKKK